MYLSKLSERLKYLMAEKDLSSESLSADVGLSGSAIRSWLRSARLPNLKSSILLSDYFHCTLDYLVGKSDVDREVLPTMIPQFYPRLRKIMEETQVTRYELVHKAHLRDSYFTNWAKGELPTLPSLCVLADYLNVSLDYLVGRTEY